ALGGDHALELIQGGIGDNTPLHPHSHTPIQSYAVVVADMRMPKMDGVELLSRLRTLTPTTVRIMLTGNADQQTAIDAVNEGHIFRFLNKPCPPETLEKTLRAALNQHHLITAEKELLELTLTG